MPERGILAKISPNPARGAIHVTFGNTAVDRLKRITFYDIAGRQVSELHAGPGDQAVIWSGVGPDGRQLPSGVYFVAVETDLGRQTAKVVLIR